MGRAGALTTTYRLKFQGWTLVLELQENLQPLLSWLREIRKESCLDPRIAPRWYDDPDAWLCYCYDVAASANARACAGDSDSTATPAAAAAAAAATAALTATTRTLCFSACLASPMQALTYQQTKHVLPVSRHASLPTPPDLNCHPEFCSFCRFKTLLCFTPPRKLLATV